MHILYIYTENPYLQELYSKPRQNHSRDSGFDLYLPQSIVVPANSQIKIDFEIRCQMQESEEDSTSRPYLLVPRSSIVKTPLRMSNSIGIIDMDYRGSICAFVDNIRDKDIVFEQGLRLFQIVTPDLLPIRCELVTNLESIGVTERGEGGFGSTGK